MTSNAIWPDHSQNRRQIKPARRLLGDVALIELAAEVLSRVLEPFPMPVRALHAIHLASASFLRRARQTVAVATYDPRMAAPARSLGFELHDPDSDYDAPCRTRRVFVPGWLTERRAVGTVSWDVPPRAHRARGGARRRPGARGRHRG